MDDLLWKVAEEYKVDPELLRKLIDIEQRRVHSSRRVGIRDQLRRVIEQNMEELKA